MQICYVPRKFRADTLMVIEQANLICEEYAAAGYALTLRQLYYQFVARDAFPADRRWRLIRATGKWVRDANGTPNAEPNYKWLGDIVNDARLAGMFDWDYIVDRTRSLVKLPTWASPEALIGDAAKQYLTDIWAPQKRRIEVWIEKDAAIGVIEHVCNRNNVPYFSCRGYTSTSEMWEAANRIGEYLRNGERTVILHIGDHDPSGLDMTRYMDDRLRLFISRDWANEFMGAGSHTRGEIRRDQIIHMRAAGGDIGDEMPMGRQFDALPWEIRRIALTIEQIEEYGPPPNPAKQGDSRFLAYQQETGLDESWELDALDPMVMEDLIQDYIDALRVDEIFAKAETTQEHDRAVLMAVRDNWEAIKNVHSKERPK